MASIRDRLSKVPPFEEDIPMLEEVKKISKQQTTVPQIKEDPKKVEEAPEEPVVEEPIEEVVEEKVEEPKEEVSERTAEQIEKLTEHNKQLKEENKELYQNVMESLRPPEPPPEPFGELTPQLVKQVDQITPELRQPQVEDIYAKLIDKDGYIDPDLLIKTLRDANELAKQARIEAELAKKEAQEAKAETKRTKRDFEESKEVRLVHKKYPQIDPKSDQFDENFWDDVRKEIATAPILKGTTPSFMEATDLIWNARYAEKKEVEGVKKAEKEKIEEAENAKRNINASAQAGRPTDYYAQSEQEDLRQASILGKKGALAERL